MRKEDLENITPTEHTEGKRSKGKDGRTKTIKTNGHKGARINTTEVMKLWKAIVIHALKGNNRERYC